MEAGEGDTKFELQRGHGEEHDASSYQKLGGTSLQDLGINIVIAVAQVRFKIRIQNVVAALPTFCTSYLNFSCHVSGSPSSSLPTLKAKGMTLQNRP